MTQLATLGCFCCGALCAGVSLDLVLFVGVGERMGCAGFEPGPGDVNA